VTEKSRVRTIPHDIGAFVSKRRDGRVFLGKDRFLTEEWGGSKGEGKLERIRGPSESQRVRASVRRDRRGDFSIQEVKERRM